MNKSFSISKTLKKRNIKNQAKAIKESNLFDVEWYLSQNKDVKDADVDPILHFLEHGIFEGRTPNPEFDCDWYSKTYDDVRAAGINPFLHYVKFGQFEDRQTHAASQFNSKSRYNSIIGDLSQKLWGGFSGFALTEIKEIAHNKSKSERERSQSLYILGRWYCTNQEWQKAYDCLREIRKIDIKMYRSKRTKLLIIECLLHLGMSEKVLDFIQPSLMKSFDGDYICALANKSSSDKISKINEIYEYNNLANINLLNKDKEFEFGNFDAKIDGERISGGPKVSILVPVYNAEEFIETAINSLLNQTWSNLEIIAVNDCSSDNSLLILNELSEKDPRLKVYNNEENLGAYGTRNKALSLSSGDYITVHDSDDWSHPQMLEVQLGAMFANPRLKITCSMMTRVSPDMRFMLRPQRNNLEYIHRSYPSVLIRKKDISALGEWDGVSANADDEFVQRARILWGDDSVKDVLTGVPLSFFLVHENSLTQNKKTSLNSLTFGIRQEYSRQAKYWKENKCNIESDELKLVRKSLKEPFPIPAGLAPNNWSINRKYDIIIISDLSLLGGTRRCNEGYIDAALKSGKRIGLYHWPRYDLKVAPIANEYTELSYSENIDILVPEDEIVAELVIIHHPPILKYEIDAVPTINCKRVAILINQSPMQLWSDKPHYYNSDDVVAMCKRLFNCTPIWIAISPIVIEALEKAGGNWALWKEIWFPPYHGALPNVVPRRNNGFGSERKIVIGRHSRDHWTKWPESAEEIMQAYCSDAPKFEVRLLGGVKTPKKVLKALPDNWIAFDFDSVDVKDFIDELDFFLHYTHSDYIEEFGRNVMEAMARGKVVILPPVYKKTFGNAAIYCNYSEVSSVISEFWNDPEKYDQQTAIGLQFVKKNCSLDVVSQKLERLLSERL